MPTGICPKTRFQSTHPVRGATRRIDRKLRAGLISIHAPRAGCDQQVWLLFQHNQDFNPRTPCGVRRLLRCRGMDRQQFQSTHPVRGATSRFGVAPKNFMISIHAPRAGCDVPTIVSFDNFNISIHAPRAGCDAADGRSGKSRNDFNPRTPCGVRRKHCVQRRQS